MLGYRKFFFYDLVFRYFFYSNSFFLDKFNFNFKLWFLELDLIFKN